MPSRLAHQLQAFGFLMMFVLFMLCGALYDTLVSDAIKVFQFLCE